MIIRAPGTHAWRHTKHSTARITNPIYPCMVPPDANPVKKRDLTRHERPAIILAKLAQL